MEERRWRRQETGRRAGSGFQPETLELGTPYNPAECWSAGVLGRWSNLATHHPTPLSAVLSSVLSAEGPAKGKARRAKEGTSAEIDRRF